MTKSDNLEREERILDAAAGLIAHYGYDKTTVSDIAQEAGISKGAVYLHFKSKDDLFEALLLREMLRYSAEWMELVEADPQGGTMAGVYKNILYALKNNPFMVAIFTRDQRVLGAYMQRPDSLYRQQGSGSMRYEFVRLMQDAGAIRTDIDPKAVAHIMNMLAFALVSMDPAPDAEDIPSLDETIEAIAEMMDRALTPDSEGANEAGKAIIRKMVAAGQQQFEQIRKSRA